MDEQNNQEPQNQTSSAVGSNTTKKLGLLGLALLFILGASACALRRIPTEPLDLGITVPSVEEESTPPETQVPGIGVSRTKFINYYNWIDFEEADPVDGMENFIGTWDTSYMQFLGKDAELYQASVNGFVSAEDSNSGALNSETVSEFAGLVNPDSTDWTAREYSQALENDCQDYSATTRYGYNEFRITCSQMQLRNLFGLTIFDSRVGRL